MKDEKDPSPIIDLKTKKKLFAELSTLIAEADKESAEVSELHAENAQRSREVRGRQAASRAVNRRWFGGGLLVVAIFLVALCNFIPPGFYRYLFLGFSLVLVIVGAWQIDRAKRDQVEAEFFKS